MSHSSMGIGDMCAMGNMCGMSNRCMSICGMGNMSNWCSMSNMCGMSNRSMSICSMGNMYGGLVNSHVVLVNHRGFYNMLDGVNDIGFGYGIRLRYFYGVGFGNVFFDDHFAFHGDGDGHWDLDLVFVDKKLGFDAGDLWGHDGVGTDGGLDFGDCHSVSGCGSLVSGCWRDGSVWQGCMRDDWRSNGEGGFGSFGGFGHVSVCGSLVNGLFLSVGVAHLDGLGANLDGTMSHDFLVSLMDGWSRNNVLMNLCSHYWRGNNVGVAS